MNGKYGVYNRKDGQKGAVFWFSIPYINDSFQEEVQTDMNLGNNVINHPSITTQIRKISQLRFLLVDDALSIQKILSGSLRRNGHIVDVLDNGLKATRLLIGLSNKIKDAEIIIYDIVLMDLQMPVMDGCEAIRTIREWEAKQHYISHQLIVAMSANSDVETVQEALEAGADYFIMKPFQQEKLDDICSKYLENKI